MSGFESTGADGHIGAWFTNKAVDPRLPAQQRIDAFRRVGGITALNHPNRDVGFSSAQFESLRNYARVRHKC